AVHFARSAGRPANSPEFQAADAALNVGPRPSGGSKGGSVALRQSRPAIHGHGETRMLKLAIAALVGTSALMAVPAPAQAQDYNRHRGGDTITCASHNGQYNSCRLPYRGNVRLVHQYSDRACVRGRTWGQ